MNIIIGKEAAEQLSDKMIVLELETLEKDGKQITAYCVVPGDKIDIKEMANLKYYKQLHEDMIDRLNKGETKFVRSAIEYLKGSFGGELDTFYLHLEDKFKEK
jgi:hypothetical protein